MIYVFKEKMLENYEIQIGYKISIFECVFAKFDFEEEIVLKKEQDKSRRGYRIVYTLCTQIFENERKTSTSFAILIIYVHII